MWVIQHLTQAVANGSETWQLRRRQKSQMQFEVLHEENHLPADKVRWHGSMCVEGLCTGVQPFYVL